MQKAFGETSPLTDRPAKSHNKTSLQTALTFIFLAHFATFIKFKLSSCCFVPGLVKIKCTPREQNASTPLRSRRRTSRMSDELSSQPLEGISAEIDLFPGLRTLCAKWFDSAGICGHLVSMESRQARPSAADKAEEAFKIPRVTYLILMRGRKTSKVPSLAWRLWSHDIDNFELGICFTFKNSHATVHSL